MSKRIPMFTVVHACNGEINPRRTALCAFVGRGGRLTGGAVTSSYLDALQSANDISAAHGGGHARVVTANKAMTTVYGPVRPA